MIYLRVEVGLGFRKLNEFWGIIHYSTVQKYEVELEATFMLTGIFDSRNTLQLIIIA
jgi:hypothetical protein